MKKKSKLKAVFYFILFIIFSIYVISDGVKRYEDRINKSNAVTKEVISSDSDKRDRHVSLTGSGAIYLSEESEIVFTLYSTPSFTGEIELYMNDIYQGMMHDDGLDGDEKANDGKYSYALLISSTVLNEKFDFYAKCGDLVSTHDVKYSYDSPEISDEEWQEQRDLTDAVDEKLQTYLVNGFVPYNQVNYVCDELYTFILNYADENDVKLLVVEKYDSEIYILFSSGIPMVIILPLEGVDSTGTNDNITIRTLEPYCNNGAEPLKSFENNAHYIQNQISYCVTDTVLKDSDVSVEKVIDAFKDNSIILWHGHGTYIPEYGSLLCISIKTNTEFKKKYARDIKEDRIVLLKDGTITLSDKFFDKYLDSVDNSFIYLGACHSYESDGLGNAFLDKGASVVVGFSDTVYSAYDCAVMDMMSKELCVPHDNILFSAHQNMKTTLRRIKKELGENDIVYAQRYLHIDNLKETTAALVCEGDPDYYIGDVYDKKKLEPYGKIAENVNAKIENTVASLQEVADKNKEDAIASIWLYIKDQLIALLYRILEYISGFLNACTE